MATVSDIRFEKGDYLINGKPFLRHLSQHEGVTAQGFIPAFLGSGSLQHYTLMRKPDLIEGATALYLCSHCGGYDGSPIGAKIEMNGDIVIWDKIGQYVDFEDDSCPPIPFKKVRKYVFELSNYMSFIEAAKIHETPYYG